MDTSLSEEGRPARRGVRYRHHPVEFKRAVVEQSLQPGVSVSRLAREHGINANQVFAWRKAYQEGRLGAAAFLPVTVAPGTAPVIETSRHSAEFGRLVLERRGARLIIEGQPDAQTLSQVLSALLR
jgi:transposase